ncbi:MAG TPA: putative glycoside hydrolase [Thermomicrobiaceae bacterium]|nr:putative glycoside hydrolase [Thermomicrobiaceae bacterium]
MSDNVHESGAPRRRWGGIGWRFSLVLVVALLALAGTLAYQQVVASRRLTGTILDDYTGRPIPGATVIAGSIRAATNDGGQFQVHRGISTVQVAATGYDSTTVNVPAGSGTIVVRLRPNTVGGAVLNRVTGHPIAGATVAIAGGTTTTTHTDARGQFTLRPVPPGASLLISAPGYAAVTIAPGHRERLDVALRPDRLAGMVRDAAGKPVAGAQVAVGTLVTTTGNDGSYRLDGVPATGQVMVKAAGFEAQAVPLDPSLHVDASLRSQSVRAVYADPATVATSASLTGMIGMISKTELNAVVVDIKDDNGRIYYDTGVALAHQIGAVQQGFDPGQLLSLLHQHGIYAIARIDVFDDPTLSAQRPDLAIHTSSGAIWHAWDGRAWVNPYQHQAWDYNTALAVEAARLGFNEVLLNGVQFPVDGPLSQIDYGVPDTAASRDATIHDFLAQVHAALADTPTMLSVEVPGSALWQLDGGGTGVRLSDVATAVDYVCPTVYPSSFPSGDLGYSLPNDHPFEVVLWSLQAGGVRVADGARELRPWLQDFSRGPGISYGDAQVTREIQASGDSGANGWMLWNPTSDYHSGALKPG